MAWDGEVDDGAPQVRRPSAPAVHMPVRIGNAARWACAALSLAILVGAGIAYAMYREFTNTIPRGAPVPGDLRDPDGAAQNILLVGDDTRTGATAAELKALHTGHDLSTVNADTMMVLHVPANGRRPTLISFPRDSWVTIPGHGMNKLNAAYPIGYNEAKAAHQDERNAESAGLILTIRTIHALTGLHIDHYMQVSLFGFYRISNAIGGVTVCLNHAQNASTDRDQYHSGYSGIDLPAGVSVIKGAQALAFVRQRHGLPHGDLDRIRRQQYFLAAAFDKVSSAGVLLNPFKLHRLMTAVGSSLLIDPQLDLMSLANQFMDLSSGKIKFTTIPNNGPQTIYPDGVMTSIVQVNAAAIPDFVAHLDGGGPTLAKAKPVPPSSVTVDVLNGTPTPRLAARNGDQLVTYGFRINDVGSGDPTAQTTIEYPAGADAQAKAVLDRVPGAKTVETSAVQRVTLLLGTNGVQVKGLVVAHTTSSSSHPVHRDPTQGRGCID
jgi:LCP family protein required for cell wall assembly